MIAPYQNAIASGVLLAALALVGWSRHRPYLAWTLVSIAVAVEAWLGVLVPQDLLHLPAWTGLGRECLLLPLAAVYGLAARAAGRPWLPPWPAMAVAPILGALLGEVPAAAILSSGATDRKAAARLALGAAAGGLVGRLGDPALLLLGERAPSLAWQLLPTAGVALVLAGPRRGDLALAGGDRRVTAVAAATALLALIPGLAPWALLAGGAALGGIAWKKGQKEPPAGELAWVAASVVLVLGAVAGGLSELTASSLEWLDGLWGHLPAGLMVALSGLAALLVDGPAVALYGASVMDRALSFSDPLSTLRAVAVGAALGGLGPLVAAGAVRAGIGRLLGTLVVGSLLWQLVG